MTICIAAICGGEDGSPRAVIASDRMVTLGGFIEFEHTVPKMTNASSNGVAMIAGETLTGTRLAREVADALSGSTPMISEIADHLAEHYKELRNERVEQQVMGARGLTMAEFYVKHSALNPQIAMMLDQQMAGTNLGVEILLAGVDRGGAHIYSVHNPGPPPLQHDVIGYAAVGSGMLHALQSMIGFSHGPTASLKETLFRVYASKKRSEVAPGVGTETDIVVISPAGIEPMGDDTVKQLEDLYASYQEEVRKSLTDKLNGLTLDSNGEVVTNGA